ncbi:MAG: metal-dependent hydrolase [Bacteroidia bacterium]
MDSITQIVLGAAVGEFVLGRKVGNKAMLWGAIAGTIPDLDVYQSLIFDTLRANELHRGFSHSILFSVIFAPILAWLVSHKEKWTLALLIPIILGFPLISISNIAVKLGLIGVIGVILYFTLKNNYTPSNASQKEWRNLMFWSLITHPLLDCHTTWGTQLFWPLPYKLAWNNIFVVDPLYTVPFLLCVTAAMFYARESKTRKWLNYTGIVLSTTYMLWSLGVKWYTYRIFEDNFEAKGIIYSRLTTVPTPANTFLWSATADGDSVLYTGLYSIFDKDKNVDFISVPTNHELLNQVTDTTLLNRLNFLSKDWYVVSLDSNSYPIYSDARYGPMYIEPNKPNYGFGYQLVERGGKWRAEQGDPPREKIKPMLQILWNRIWGKSS